MDDVAAGTGTLWTIGHSTREWTVFTAMLSDAGIQVLVDVRRFAGSRRNPQFSGETMARTLPEAGFRYLSMPDLGGRRKADPDTRNLAITAAGGLAAYLAKRLADEPGGKTRLSH